MSSCASKFVSAFRIDGKPILPPLMTPEKRAEMRKYREQAIRLEQKRLKKDQDDDQMPTNRSKDNKGSIEEYCFKTTDKVVEDSYLLLSKLVLHENQADDISLRTRKLQKSETIIYDNITNTVIVPMETDVERLRTTTIPAINIDPPTPLSTRSFMDEEIRDYAESYAGMETSVEYTAECLPLTPPKRSATSPALNQLSNLENSPTSCDSTLETQQPSLIRSNSFTLKTPSKALVEHMRQQEARKLQMCKKEITKPTVTPYVARDTIESKAKRQQKVEKTDRALKLQANNAHSLCLSETKNKRSPYETKPKLARNFKKSVNSLATSGKNSPASGNCSVNLQRKFKTVSADKNTVQQKTLLMRDPQAEKRHKFLRLLAEQQEEQERMLEVFALQRNQLLQELTCKVALEENATEQKFNHSSQESSPKKSTPFVSPRSIERSPTNSKLKSTDHSRRQLFSDHHNNSSTTCSSFNSSGKTASFVCEQRKRVFTNN